MSTGRQFRSQAARQVADASSALGNLDRPEQLSCEMALYHLNCIDRTQLDDGQIRELDSYLRWIDDRRLGIYGPPDLPADQFSQYLSYLALKIERSGQD